MSIFGLPTPNAAQLSLETQLGHADKVDAPEDHLKVTPSDSIAPGGGEGSKCSNKFYTPPNELEAMDGMYKGQMYKLSMAGNVTHSEKEHGSSDGDGENGDKEEKFDEKDNDNDDAGK